jgi:hypothetical protein
MSETKLPDAVDAFIEATNRFDLDGMLGTFAPDAIVNDHGWLAEELVGARVTMKPTEASRRGESATVSAEMDGTYDKTGLPTPLVLSFYFSVDRDRIVQLVIVHNKPKTAPAQ